MTSMYDMIFLFEVILPFLLLSIGLSIVVFYRKKQDKKSLQKLISQFKEKEVGRRESVI